MNTPPITNLLDERILYFLVLHPFALPEFIFDTVVISGAMPDHNWVLDTPLGRLALDATVYEPETGRVLQVLSTQPGLQFYTGNFLDGTLVGKGSQRYAFRSGFCMEPQHFPDSPNHPDFPSTILKPGQVYRSTIDYRFTTRG